MTDTSVWVHLNDEIPRLGSGQRRVIVRSVGRKWVKLTKPVTGQPIVVPRRVWDTVKKVVGDG